MELEVFFTIKLRKANEVKIVNQAKSIVNKILLLKIWKVRRF
jgi:hypothetical protein